MGYEVGLGDAPRPPDILSAVMTAAPVRASVSRIGESSWLQGSYKMLLLLWV